MARDPQAVRPTTRLAPHVVALALLMLVLLPVVGWHGIFSTDEGAALAQAEAVADDGTFALAHGFPAADPTGAAFPLERSSEVDDGFAPLPKRPAYIVLLAGLDPAGVAAMIVVSIAGTVMAAFLAALIARRLDPSLDVLTFWVTGLASPLLVDGYLVIAHALGAAISAGALLAMLRMIERPSVLRGAVVVGLIAAAITVRAEAVIFGLAISIAVGIFWVIRRGRVWLYISGIALLGVALGTTADLTLRRLLIGEAGSAPRSLTGAPALASDGFLQARWEGLTQTLFRPGYGSFGTTSVLLVTLVLVGLWGVVALRKEEPDHRFVRVLAGVVVAVSVALILQTLLGEPQIVPGMLLAFPLGVWGIASLDRTVFQSRVAQLLALTFLLFGLGVVASQYEQGGGFEWGWRYVAIGVPALTPLVAAGLRNLRTKVSTVSSAPSQIAVVASSLTIAFMGIVGVAHVRDVWHRVTVGVTAAADQTTPGDHGEPVILSTEPELPRAAWDTIDDYRWLLVEGPDLPIMLRRLERLGIQEIVLGTKGTASPTFVAGSPFTLGDQQGPEDDDTWWAPILTRR